MVVDFEVVVNCVPFGCEKNRSSILTTIVGRGNRQRIPFFYEVFVRGKVRPPGEPHSLGVLPPSAAVLNHAVGGERRSLSAQRL